MIAGLGAILLFALQSPSALPAPADVAPPAADACPESCAIPPPYQADIARAEALGRRIYLHDKAAWLSTDALLAAAAFESPPGRMRGWFTQPGEGGMIGVGYLAKVSGNDVVFAWADTWPESGGVANARRLETPMPLEPAQRRIVDATRLAVGAGGSLNCSNGKPFNTVAFEDGSGPDAGILVFLMSAWTNESAPLGGYEMFRTDPEGTTIRERFAQTRGCLSMPAADFAKASALLVTHLTSSTPTAFHVFMSLQYAKPVYVSTEDMLWVVEDGHVRVADTTKGIGSEIKEAMGSKEVR